MKNLIITFLLFSALFLMGIALGDDKVGLKKVPDGKVHRMVFNAKSLTFNKKDFPGDGGSVVFEFQTDKGVKFCIYALHHKDLMGGNSSYQQIDLMPSWSGRNREELKKKSQTEAKLIKLLGACALSKDAEVGLRTAPTRKSLDWLLERIKDRKQPWDQKL